MERMKRGMFLSLLAGIFILPLASAFPYFFSPEYALHDLFNSITFRFILSFVLFYALFFYAASQAFRNERSIAVVVATVVSLLISYALLDRGFLSFYFENEFMSWMVLLALLTLLGIVFRYLYLNASKPVAIVAVLLTVIGICMINDSGHPSLYNLPEGAQIFLEYACGPVGWIIALILMAIISMKKVKVHDHHRLESNS